jgi:hypothetical protein
MQQTQEPHPQLYVSKLHVSWPSLQEPYNSGNFAVADPAIEWKKRSTSLFPVSVARRAHPQVCEFLRRLSLETAI